MKTHLSIPTALRRTLVVLGAITLAATASAQTPLPAFTNLWNLSSGTNAPDLPNDLPLSLNNVRGIAINPVTTNVLYASTTGGTNNGNNHITVLDAANNGAYLAQLNASGVAGGTLNLAPVRAAEDGRLRLGTRQIALPHRTRFPLDAPWPARRIATFYRSYFFSNIGCNCLAPRRQRSWLVPPSRPRPLRPRPAATLLALGQVAILVEFRPLGDMRG